MEGPWCHERGDDRPGSLFNAVRDTLVPDVFPWQLIGPPHIRRYGGLPPGATPLSSGYAELELAPADRRLLAAGFDDSYADDLGPAGHAMRERGLAALGRILYDRDTGLAHRPHQPSTPGSSGGRTQPGMTGMSWPRATMWSLPFMFGWTRQKNR